MTQTIEQLQARVALISQERNGYMEAADRACDERDEFKAKVAELELEVARLRSVMADVIKAHGYTGGTPVEVMSTPSTTTTLNELIEKVEKMTIERCAVITAWSIIDMPTTVEISTVRKYSKAIRALPTGQIKLEELL